MRTISCTVLFAVAFISTASAQEASWAMDHGNAAAAVSAQRAAAAAAQAKAAAIAAGRPLTPSQATDASISGRNVIRAAPLLTPEEQNADAEARSAWQARCRPAVVEDSEGIRRTKYAESDCDLSRFSTAGTQ
jgi:hypothetical protein